MPLNALKDADRALLIGMGGGGDVAGALAVTDLLDGLGTEWVLGGVAWERSPIDPRPGPRSLDEIRGGRRCGSAAVLTEGATTSLDGVEFSESRMAAAPRAGRFCCSTSPGARRRSRPASLRRPRSSAATAIVLLDVGGDVLAHGDEPGLASPLCDAVVLAAGPSWRVALAPSTTDRVIGAVYGPGCDGELTPDEVLERITEPAGSRCAARRLGTDAAGRRAGHLGGRGGANRGEPEGRALRSRRARASSHPRRPADRRAHSARRAHLLPRSASRPPARRFLWPRPFPPPTSLEEAPTP